MEREEIEYLYGLRRFGMRMDLSVMREFIALVGNPHEDLKFAHVAGTNGKGSVSSYLYGIMKRKYRTGLYTSPHLVRFNERIVVDDVEIDDDYIVNFVREYRPIIEALAREMRNPTFFEVTTSMALKYFREMGVEFAVMEVGLGGRLDATNIINPDVTAITSVDLEHTKVLGKTIPKIAREKAGIIKNGVPVVVGENKKSANRVIMRIAENHDATYHNVNEECEVDDLSMDIDGMRMRLLTPVKEYSLRTSMLGVHQVRNIMVAVRMAEILQENYSLSAGDIKKGIENARWRGRFEVKRKNPLLIFDAAHNPAGARVLAATLRKLKLRNLTLLFSMLDGKDIDGYMRHLRGLVDRAIVTEIDYYRKMEGEKIRDIVGRYVDDVVLIKDSCDALHHALNTEDRILATGSIYLLGELESCLER